MRKRKTHCPRGHEFTEANLIVNNRGYRVCKLCKALRDVKYRNTHRVALRRYKRQWMLDNPEKRKAYWLKFKADSSKPCVICAKAISSKAFVCKECRGFIATVFQRVSTTNEVVVQYIKSLKNPQLKRSYQWLRDNKRQLRNLRKELKAGRMEISHAQELWRGLDSKPQM